MGLSYTKLIDERARIRWRLYDIEMTLKKTTDAMMIEHYHEVIRMYKDALEKIEEEINNVKNSSQVSPRSLWKDAIETPPRNRNPEAFIVEDI